MKTERELFEGHFKPITGWDFYWSDSINQYVDHQTNAAWLGWQASANREGYKLVPLELADEIEDKIWDNLSANHTITNQEGDGFIPVEDIDLVGIYKAMIGVSE